MNRVLFTLILILGSIVFSQAQLKQVNNPNLAQKRLNYETAKNQPSQATRQSVDYMSMAQKYEETAIRRWKKDHPSYKYISSEEYNMVPDNKKSLLEGRVFVYSGTKVKWSDIERFEAKNQRK